MGPTATACCAVEKPFQEYLPEAVQAQEAAKRRQNLEDGTEEESLSSFVVSSLPWITYDGIAAAHAFSADLQSRIDLGAVTAGREHGPFSRFPFSATTHW